jgi:hypothetical protein
MAVNLKGLMGSLGQATTLFSHMHLVTSMIDALRGKDLPAGSPAASQGVSGFIGKGDERKLQIIFARLTTAEKKILTDFFNWHFKGETVQDKLLAAWYMGSFRVFATGIKGSNVPTGTSKTTTTLPEKDGTKTVTETSHTTFADEYQPAVDFLREIVRIIRSGKTRHKKLHPTSTEEEQLAAGYETVVAYFTATGVPSMPPKSQKDWGAWASALGVKSLNELQGWYSGATNAIHEAYTAEMEEITKPTLFQRLVTNPLLKLIS